MNQMKADFDAFQSGAAAKADTGMVAGYLSTDMFIQALKKVAAKGKSNITPANVRKVASTLTWQIKGVAGPTTYPTATVGTFQTVQCPCAQRRHEVEPGVALHLREPEDQALTIDPLSYDDALEVALSQKGRTAVRAFSRRGEVIGIVFETSVGPLWRALATETPRGRASGEAVAGTIVNRLVARWVPPMTFVSAVLIDWPEAGVFVEGTGKRSGQRHHRRGGAAGCLRVLPEGRPPVSATAPRMRSRGSDVVHR